jgi:hypothetical protein
MIVMPMGSNNELHGFHRIDPKTIKIHKRSGLARSKIKARIDE